MGKKVKKEVILTEIQDKINICLEYQKKDPDETAKKRLQILENDPCGDLTYYINITLKDTLSETSTDFSDRRKHIQNKRCLPIIKEFNSSYEDGCIITVNIIKNKNQTNYKVEATSYKSLDEMFSFLMTKYFDNSCLLSTLNPKKPISGDNYIQDDYDTAIETNKSSIVYGIARFNKKVIEDFLKSQFDVNKYDLYSYDIGNFHEVSYPDMTRKTSFEQNVNQFLGGSAVNSVTMFGTKTKLPNENMKNTYGIYDIGRYVSNTLDEIKKSDDAQARLKYNQYSKNIFKDDDIAKYDLYKENGGTDDWSNWSTAQKQFLTFKSISSYDKDFRNEALNNKIYANNLYAYEQTADIFLNSKSECINQYWKNENDTFKKMKISDIIYSNDYSSNITKSAKTLIEEKLIDPPSVIVKPYSKSNIQFSKDLKYDFNVFVPREDDDKKIEEAILISKPNEKFERVQGYFISSNKIFIKRDSIKLDGIEYEYTNVKITIDKNNSLPFTNEMTKAGDIYEIPAESYYNKSLNVFFEAKDLDNRIIPSTITYSLIPKSISIPVHFIQHSCWENKEAAEEHKKKVMEEYKNTSIRICIDAIPYDPWDKMIEKLENLYGKINSIQTNNDGMIEIPPIDEVDAEELNNSICKKCKKSMKECECDKFKVCSKCFPIDLDGTAEDAGADYSLLNATSFIFNQDGTAATYSQIAKSIYSAVYSFDYNSLSDDEFSTASSLSSALTSIDYDMLISSPAFKVKNSVVSQFTKDDFERFKEEYLNLISLSSNAGSENFCRHLPVGLIDGILYLPTGYDIVFEFNPKTGLTTLYDVPMQIMQSVSSLQINAVSDLDEAISSIRSSFNEDQIPEDLLKYIIFPYMPNIMNMIANIETDKNEVEYLEEFKDDYIYKVNYSDLKNAKSSLTSTSLSPILVRFSIYIKKSIRCSYPRCKNPIYETESSFGVCELDQYFRNPIIIKSNKFSFEEEYNKLKIRLSVNQMKKSVKELIDNVIDIKNSSCNSDKNINIINDAQLKTLDDLYKFGNENKELLNSVPADKLNTSSKSSIICEAAKNFKLKSIMEDYNEVFSHLINTILILKEDYYNATEKTFNSIISDLSTCSNIIEEYYKEIETKSPIFNMCEVKFSDYLNTNNEFKSVNTGIVERGKSNSSNLIESIIEKRIKNNEILSNVKSLNLSEDDSVKLSKMISDGAVKKIKAFANEITSSVSSGLSSIKESLSNKISESLSGLNELANGSTSSNSLLSTISNKIKSCLNPDLLNQISMSSMKDKLIELGNNPLIEQAKNKLTDLGNNQLVNQGKNLIK